MNVTELLGKNPLATEHLRTWFYKKLEESCKDPSIPDEFKEYILQRGVELEQVERIIEEHPSGLFYFFDENKIFIEISRCADESFTCQISNYTKIDLCKSRKEAESYAVEIAFDMLEGMLDKYRSELQQELESK
jgi:hypothetical protein